MLTRVRQIEIEQAVIELLEEYDLGVYPISIREILETLQVSLVAYSSLNDKEKELVNLASQDRAFSVISRDYMRAQVVFDDTRGFYFCRSRFSGGHEIGHLWLEHDEGMLKCEAEADYFAGYLLAPHPLIITMKSPSVAEVSECFGISRGCASFAIDQAKIRKREGGSWRYHEKWLLEHAQWSGGGLSGRP